MNDFSQNSSHSTPEISVVMPVYNSAEFLRCAIESILAQTHQDFEFIIINDGSTDNSSAIIHSYTDPRIRVLENDRNLGLASSFNKGIGAARGIYIARMDADDIARPNRLQLQHHFLRAHPTIGVVGSGMNIMDKSGTIVGRRARPTSHLLIKYGSLYSNAMFHPTVMARTKLLQENPYDERYIKSEDYELWSRLLFQQGAIFANIRTNLVTYRSYAQSTTQRPTTIDGLNSARVITTNLRHYVFVPPDVEEDIRTLRRERMISFRGMKRVWQVYAVATSTFIKQERPSILQRGAISAARIQWGLNLIRAWLRGQRRKSA